MEIICREYIEDWELMRRFVDINVNPRQHFYLHLSYISSILITGFGVQIIVLSGTEFEIFYKSVFENSLVGSGIFLAAKTKRISNNSVCFAMM